MFVLQRKSKSSSDFIMTEYSEKHPQQISGWKVCIHNYCLATLKPWELLKLLKAHKAIHRPRIKNKLTTADFCEWSNLSVFVEQPPVQL